MTDIPEEQRHWTIDKRVPVAMIVAFTITIIGQTIAASWWLSDLSSRVATLEDYRVSTSTHEARLVKLETTAENIRAALDNISAKLDRLIERQQ